MSRDPNDFTKSTIETLAKRANQTCSYCKCPTSGPHTDPSKSINIGEAAHIRGAKPTSARYDDEMFPKERSAITNGIWLCQKHHKLIDNDEAKFTVDVLIQMKKEHEAEVQAKVEGNEWQMQITKDKLKPFENESAAAQQIVLDKPKYWEFLLFLELFRPKFKEIKREFDDLKRGLIYKPSKRLGIHDFIQWNREKLKDLEALVTLLKVAVTEEMNSSWGEIGQPGNELEIKRAADKIILGCRGLLEWETDVKFTTFPDECEHIKKKMEGWAEPIALKMETYPKDIAKMLDQPNPTGKYYTHVVLEFPKNSDEVLRDIEEFAKRYL